MLAIGFASLNEFVPCVIGVSGQIGDGEEFAAKGLVVGRELCPFGQSRVVGVLVEGGQCFSRSYGLDQDALLAFERRDLCAHRVRRCQLHRPWPSI